MKLNLMYSYWCEERCSYCYLGDKRDNRVMISSSTLENTLKTLKDNITSVEIDGGEISALRDFQDYLRSIVYVLKTRCDDIRLSTNLYNPEIINLADELGIKLYVSYNTEQTSHSETMMKVMALPRFKRKNLGVQVVVLPSILEADIDQLLYDISAIGHRVRFIQYQPFMKGFNQGLMIPNTNRQFSEFMLKVFDLCEKNDYNLVVENFDDYMMDNRERCTIDNNVTINPYGKFLAPRFVHGCATWVEYDTFSDYSKAWAEEMSWYNRLCRNCDYFSECYARFLQPWFKGDECCGLKSLVDFFQKRKGNF